MMPQPQEGIKENKCILCVGKQAKFKYKIENYNFYRCRNCGLVFVHPIPSRDNLENIYQQNDFYAKGFQRNGGPEINRRMRVVERYGRKGKLLDIGCAAGYFLALAKKRGWDTLGIEVSKHTAEYATKQLNLKIINKPLEEIELTENLFDVISFWGVIEHVADPVSFMKKIVTLLKEGGLVCLATNNVDGWMGWLMGDKFPFITYPEHLWLFNICTIKKLMQQSGLKIVRIDTFDTITPDKAIRGLSKLFRGRANKSQRPGIERTAKILTVCIQPLIWILGKLKLGSEVEIYAKKLDD